MAPVSLASGAVAAITDASSVAGAGGMFVTGRFSENELETEVAETGMVVDSGAVSIVGVGRLIRLREGRSAEMSLIVSDAFQGHGLGRELLRRLLDVARTEGLASVVAEILAANGTMIALVRELGFEVGGDPASDTLHAEIRLDRPAA